MDNPEPRAYRNVVIYVAQSHDEFPPASNTSEDVALIRAANLARQRKAQGCADVFLFVVVGERLTAAASAAPRAYGFPDAELVFIELSSSDERGTGSDHSREEVDIAIRSWLHKNHPSSLGYAASPYNMETFWWIGIDGSAPGASRFAWPFSVAAFAGELPASQERKAATWLSILIAALDLEAGRVAVPEGLLDQRCALAAATLCEWLHGFEAASGNGYNDLDSASVIESFDISPLYLGFEASRHSGEELEILCHECDVDIDRFAAIALGIITRDQRDALRERLANFFCGNGWLFWTLHSAIWPTFEQPMRTRIHDLVNASSFEAVAEYSEPWIFISEGWCEAAD